MLSSQKREAEAAEAERAAAAAKERQRVRLYGSALFVLAPDNGLRLRFRAFVEHPWFDRVVLMLIVCSSITLALDTPDLDPDSTRADVRNGVCLWRLACGSVLVAGSFPFFFFFWLL